MEFDPVNAIVVVALGLFVVANIDTLVVLMAFFRDEQYNVPEIAVGHFFGFGVGLLGALIATVLAEITFYEFAFLLGVVPLGLGILGFFRQSEDSAVADPTALPGQVSRAGIVTMAGIGLSGENIALFVPFFITLTTFELTVVILLYLFAAGVTLLVAFFSVRQFIPVSLPAWIDDRFVPLLLIVVGVYVLTTGWIAAELAFPVGVRL